MSCPYTTYRSSVLIVFPRSYSFSFFTSTPVDPPAHDKYNKNVAVPRAARMLF
jgi:hypothetical protein